MNCALKSMTIRTVGTDVVGVAVAHFQGLQTLSNSGQHSELVRISDTSRSIRLPLHYVLRLPKDCCYFMHSPAAT